MRNKSGIFILTLAVVMACLNAESRAEDGSLSVIRQSNLGLSRFVLDNGMICLVKPDHSAPVCSIQIWVRTGSMDEREYLGAGLSHFVEHMIFKGTEIRAPGDITREINDAGGMINAYTTLDRTVFYVNMPADKWRVGLDVLSDAVMNTAFPEEEWKREQEVIIREMAMNLDDPGRVLSRMLWSTAFTTHPIRHPVIGYKDVFMEISRDDLVDFYRRNYVPNEMIVAVVGDIKAEDMESALKEAFAGFQRRAKAPVVLPGEPSQFAPRVRKEYDRSVNVARLACAFHTVDITDPDAPALDVLAFIAGSGRSSVLSEKFVENMRLAQSIDAWSFTPKVAGLFGITAVFEPDKEEEFIEKLNEEIGFWHTRPFSETDLRKARRSVLTSTLSQFRTMEGQAGSYASGEFYAGAPLFSEIYIERLNAVTTEQLKEVAAKYLVPENRTTVVLAPEQEDVAEQEAVLSIVPPPPAKKILKNNLRVVAREDRKLPFIHGCVVVGGGLLAEKPDKNGVASLTADLLTRGTPSRTSQDIARTVESLGGSLTSFSGYNSFGLQFQCLSEDADVFFRLAADCLADSNFPQDEIDKQKQIQLAAIAQQRESPVYVASRALRGMLFPGHPYANETLGTPESLGRISREDILAYHRKALVADNIVLAVFGDISASSAEALAGSYFGNIPAGRAPAPEYGQPAPELPARVLNLEPKEQAIYMIGFPGITVVDPRHDALNILAKAMSGLSSQLMIEIRDKRGLAYFAGAYQQVGVDPGFFAIYAGTRPDVVIEVGELIAAEIKRVSEIGISEDEFERARAQIISARKHSFQDNSALAMESALNELYGLGFDHSFAETTRLMKLNPGDVRNAASEIFNLDQSAISIVVPESYEKEGENEQ